MSEMGSAVVAFPASIIIFRFSFFFFNDTATTEIYTLSLHDALPILHPGRRWPGDERRGGEPDATVAGGQARARRGARHGGATHRHAGDLSRRGERRPAPGGRRRDPRLSSGGAGSHAVRGRRGQERGPGPGGAGGGGGLRGRRGRPRGAGGVGPPPSRACPGGPPGTPPEQGPA